MLPAVKLDDQPSLRTAEIYDITARCILPLEFYAEVASPQILPEFALRVGRFGAHLARACQERAVEQCFVEAGLHFMSPFFQAPSHREMGEGVRSVSRLPLCRLCRPWG